MNSSYRTIIDSFGGTYIKGILNVWMSKKTIMAKVEKFPFKSAKLSIKSVFIELPNNMRDVTFNAAYMNTCIAKDRAEACKNLLFDLYSSSA